MATIIVRANDAILAAHIADVLRAYGWGVSVQQGKTPESSALVEATGISRQIHENLTRREREILALVSEGLTNEQVAAKTCITVRTVRQHVSNLLRKLDAQNRAQLAILFRSASVPVACRRGKSPCLGATAMEQASAISA